MLQSETMKPSGALPVPAAKAADRAPAAGRIPEDEFERFYGAHARQLWAYVHRMCGNAATADDLLQKTFVRLLQATGAPGEERALKAYVYRIATNVVFDHFRSLRVEERTIAADMPPLPIETGAILRADMARVFGRLKPRERALLWLAHVEGYDHSELGGMIGVGEKSVRVLLFRARKKLGAMLKEEGIMEAGR